MKLLHIVLGLLAASALSAKTWTNSAGKTIEADFVTADAINVTVQLSDGRQFVLPLVSLSEAD